MNIVVPKKRRGLLKPKAPLSRKEEARMVALLVAILEEPPEPLLCKHCKDTALICVKCGEEAKTRVPMPFDLQNWALRRELDKIRRRMLKAERQESSLRALASNLERSLRTARESEAAFYMKVATAIQPEPERAPPIESIQPRSIIPFTPPPRKKSWWWPW